MGLSNQASYLWSDIGPTRQYARLGEKPDFRDLSPRRQAAGVERRVCVNRVDLSRSPLVCASLLVLSDFFFLFALGAGCFSRLCKGSRAPVVAGASPGAETLGQTVRLSPLPLSSATCLVAKSGFLTPRLRTWAKHLPSSAYIATSL